ncbi:hypothetical protein [Streptomyces alboniger]|uniref:Restriction endonuclease type IV Mrr domain-containing protein n=1 Tax=Streptomyces alboniger TaxID=132473 RepID=A0A5J6HQJ1_STRAD|nr:hypothetical protein [Streptomyces alboniger]QEV22609.1 hypothetical protein CP975_29015 [Streptomyces alboniger]
MADGGVPVRCPECLREHLYAPAPLPCACGAPMTAPVARGVPATPVTERSWADEWVTVRCWACGRQGQWPRPELDCDCGAVLRVPVVPAPGAPVPGRSTTAPSTAIGNTAARPRPAFRPVTIRDTRDAVTVAALYLRWLGYLNTRSAARRPPSGTRIAARGMLAQVDPGLHRTGLRDVECLWLTAATGTDDTPATCAFFSLAGYTDEARARADALDVPLFILDLTGTPQPVNSAADDLIANGA